MANYTNKVTGDRERERERVHVRQWERGHAGACDGILRASVGGK